MLRDEQHLASRKEIHIFINNLKISSSELKKMKKNEEFLASPYFNFSQGSICYHQSKWQHLKLCKGSLGNSKTSSDLVHTQTRV